MSNPSQIDLVHPVCVDTVNGLPVRLSYRLKGDSLTHQVYLLDKSPALQVIVPGLREHPRNASFVINGDQPERFLDRTRRTLVRHFEEIHMRHPEEPDISCAMRVISDQLSPLLQPQLAA